MRKEKRAEVKLLKHRKSTKKEIGGECEMAAKNGDRLESSQTV